MYTTDSRRTVSLSYSTRQLKCPHSSRVYECVCVWWILKVCRAVRTRWNCPLARFAPLHFAFGSEVLSCASRLLWPVGLIQFHLSGRWRNSETGRQTQRQTDAKPTVSHTDRHWKREKRWLSNHTAIASNAYRCPSSAFRHHHLRTPPSCVHSRFICAQLRLHPFQHIPSRPGLVPSDPPIAPLGHAVQP